MNEDFYFRGVTYQKRGRKCGKAECKCADGEELHGPYWYSRKKHGTLKYVGKELPEGLLDEIANQREATPRLREELERVQEEIEELQAERHFIQRVLFNDEFERADAERFGYAELIFL